MEPGVKAVLLLFFLVCFACNVAGSTRTQADKRDQPRWCGKKLMDILKKLCNHCFNYKRSLGFHENWGEDEASSISSHDLNSLEPAGSWHPRKRDAIVSKCCHSHCTFDDLKAYCC